MEIKAIIPAIIGKFRFKKRVSGAEVKRAEEIVKMLKNSLEDYSPMNFLASCYAKDGKIMLGKFPISSEIWGKALSDEAVQTYKTALRHDTTMSNARIILENNKRFVANREHPDIRLSKFGGFYIDSSGQIVEGRLGRPQMTPEDMHLYRQYCEKSNLMKNTEK